MSSIVNASVNSQNIRWQSVTIDDGTTFAPRLQEMEKEVEELRSEIADMILLSDHSAAVSVYDMSFEEYMELSGNVRL
jgi:hypothetical protein